MLTGMPLKVMDVVEQRLAVLREPGWSGRTVREVCRRHGISPDTFYAWKQRYDTDGLAGLQPRSRRPGSSPAQLDAALEDRIVALRKAHGWGPVKIRDALRREGLVVPASSTVQQALARHGILTPRPRRARPIRQGHRFERSASNQLWQIDGAMHHLADRSPYWTVEVIDDHSRFCPAITVGPSLTGHLTWAAVCTAVALYGIPEWILTDNGRCFTGRLHGDEVSFERRVKAAGICLTHSRPYHPQTCGKVERLHHTQRVWLARHPVPASLAQAGELFTRFRQHYNTERPHQALHGATPAEVYRPGLGIELPAVDLEPADHTPPGCLRRKTRPCGAFTYAGTSLSVGEKWGGVTIGVLREHGRLHAFYGSSLLDTFLVGSALPTPTR